MKYYAIDTTKFIASIMIVLLHALIGVESFGVFLYTSGLVRLCVPFFFICSGFFFYKNNETKWRKKYLKKLVREYSLWFVIYIPISFILVSQIDSGSYKLNVISGIFFGVLLVCIGGIIGLYWWYNSKE